MTNAATHTPGPWSCHELNEGYGVLGPNNEHVAYCDYDMDSDDMDIDGADPAEANARLIAKAPDMLDALLDAKRYLERAQSEVDHGDNDVEKVSCYINAALASVMKGLTTGG
jgi:hypothetical protein